MKQLLEKHAATVQIGDEDLLKRFPEAASASQALRDLIKRLENSRPVPLPQVSALTEPDGPWPAHHVLARGNYTKPSRPVDPGVPAILSRDLKPFQVAAGKTSGRRFALAQWLTAPGHPTTARLIANRIWQQHFGVGLVATPDNFGVTGAKPSHPELLDWLAAEFVRGGWSIKSLHRLIVLSASYRQAGPLREEAQRIDPDNRLLWRFPMRRLGAEAIRDSMLSASGELDLAMGGPFVPKAKTEEGQYVVNEKEPGARRRSLYLEQRRTAPVTMLDLFDSANMNPNCVQRPTSTVPLQSLALLNSDFVRARSKAFAQRLLALPGQNADQRVRAAFQYACGRPPFAAETSSAQQFLRDQAGQYHGAEAEQSVWTDLCQMLFASSGFLYVE